MLFKKAGAKHFVHLLLRIGLYCIKSFIIYYLLLYPFYSQLSMSALPYFLRFCVLSEAGLLYLSRKYKISLPLHDKWSYHASRDPFVKILYMARHIL